ncbi:MAG: peptide chain release factor N(5)-glutamine methyltransferase [Firmicutes bacterium HGW-Firmicutes-7]|nr:MAG: peptide chain release factor N(5)-glutamine methyltransferase [Firmicutes bacterium HGW-Firmicutes-7]
MTRTINHVLQEGTNLLKAESKENAQLDARLLLSNILNYNRVELIINKDKEIDKIVYDEYMSAIKSRVKGVPLQHITCEQEFMGLPFKVNAYTLIPRRETEELVELALSLLDKDHNQLIMDIGTGSGCIPISLASYNEKVNCIGIDLSQEALKVAKLNGQINAVADRITWIISNLFNSIGEEYVETVDMLISNPPYIKTEDINSLMTEVRDFEPHMALDGGKDGLDFYRVICRNSKKYLKCGGFIIFEIGYDQKNAVISLLEKNDFIDIQYKKDLSGKDRIVYARKKGTQQSIISSRGELDYVK